MIGVNQIPTTPVLEARTACGDSRRRSTHADRAVGIYPEIKRPAWHREEGVDITVLFLSVLGDFGYTSHQDRVYLQCFDPTELVRIRKTLYCELKLIQLIGENDWGESNTDYARLRSADGMRRLAKTVDGVGPWLNRLYRWRRSDGRISDTGLVARAHDAGLAVHPFTVRADDLPPGFANIEELLQFVIDDLSVDGLFTDFPDLVRSRSAA